MSSVHWLASAHGGWRDQKVGKRVTNSYAAAASQSMSIVTSYATIGEEGLLLSLNQGRAKAVVVDTDLIPTLIPALQKAEKVKFVIFNNEQDVSQDEIEKLKSVRDNLRVLSWEDVRLLGEGSPVEPVPPQPDDLCCLMYTSGTTGTPKGVPITHRNIVAASKSTTSMVIFLKLDDLQRLSCWT
jgi:long-chain acyl-CoA synthetase